MALELDCVFYGYHGGYALLARTESIPDSIIAKLCGSYDRYSFGSSVADLKYRPKKFRYMPLTDGAAVGYLDTVDTQRGPSPEAEFYYITPERLYHFHEEFSSNAALLLSHIGFLDHETIKKGLVGRSAKIVPRLVVESPSVPIGVAIRKLREKVTPEQWCRLFGKTVFESIDKNYKLYFQSANFTKSLEMFTCYCSGFIAALPVCYRKSLSFSSCEFSLEAKEYDLVFLHKNSVIKSNHANQEQKLILLDDGIVEEVPLWYLSENLSDEELEDMHRFVSDRMVSKNIQLLLILNKYRQVLKNPDLILRFSQFTLILTEIESHLGDISSPKLCEDFISCVRPAFDCVNVPNTNDIRHLFRIMLKASNMQKITGFWSNTQKIAFIDYFLLFWENLVITENQQLLMCVQDFALCERELCVLIMHEILRNNRGIAKFADLTKIDDKNLIANVWLVLLKQCEGIEDAIQIEDLWMCIKTSLEKTGCVDKCSLSDNSKLLDLFYCLCSLHPSRYNNDLAPYKVFQWLCLRERYDLCFNFLIIIISNNCTNLVVTELLHNIFKRVLINADVETIIGFSKELQTIITNLRNDLIEEFVGLLSKTDHPRVFQEVIQFYIFSGNSIIRHLDHHQILFRIFKKQSSSLMNDIYGVGLRLPENTVQPKYEPFIYAQEELLKLLRAIDGECTLVVEGPHIHFFVPCAKRLQILHSEYSEYFLLNVKGFVRCNWARDQILPACWTYLQMFDVSIGSNHLFSAMLSFLDSEIINSTNSLEQLSSLCTDLKRWDANVDSGIFKKLKWDSNKILFQIFAATRNDSERIQQLERRFESWIMKESELRDFIDFLEDKYFPFIDSKSVLPWQSLVKRAKLKLPKFYF